jgi:hypothetical protein
MLKALAMLVFVCVAIVAMPEQNQVGGKNPTGQSQQAAHKPHTPPIASVTNNQAATYYEQNAKEQPQGWHKFVTWPEGITALAVVFTCGAIIWQAIETRRSVNAARDAIILQYRPRIKVRSLRLVRQESGGFEIRLVLRNSGSTDAHISATNFEIMWMQTGHANEVHTEKISAVTLAGGKSHPLRFTAPEFYVRFEASRLILEFNPEQEQSAFLACSASITYQDEIGTQRETAISRLYSFRSESFVLGDNAAESDYSD